MVTRPTSAIIDTGALKFNFLELRNRIPQNTKIMAIVKANAYGHGDAEVARTLEALGCEYFGVALLEEGARLRSRGIRAPIAVLGGVYPGQMKELFELNLTPVVFDIETARRIDSHAGSLGALKKIHVKIDTGMGRLGLQPVEVGPFFQAARGLKHIQVEALLSHFVEAEAEDKEFSKLQLKLFLESVEKTKGLGFAPGFIDMANSAAAVDYMDSHLGLVRPGLMLYGSYPDRRLAGKIRLKPVMSLKTRILHLKELPAGANVSYGRRWTAKRRSLIATLPIGYADGLPRRLTGVGEALCGGRRVPMAGTVCMDLTMCDVTDVPGVKAGDEVVLIGEQGGERISAEEVAEKAGTISYEIFCGISQRVPRVYI